MYTQTDKELVLLAQSGNEEAYQKLYERFYQDVYYYARHLCKNEADARDITQDVFLEIYRSLSSLRNADMFMVWLKRITKSKAQLLFRRNKDSVYDPEIISTELGGDTRVDRMPHQAMDNRIDKEVMRKLTGMLTKRRREVIEMFYFEQMSLDEIADQLDLNVNTVKSRLHMARKDLNALALNYQDKEGRHISFHADHMLSGFVMMLLYRCRDMLSHTKALTALQVGSVATCVVVGGSALYETYATYDRHHDVGGSEKSGSALQERQYFAPLVYRGQPINSANDAYFVLMHFASDKDLLKDKSHEELAEIAPVVEQLRQEDSYYYDVLMQRGWLETYDALK